MSSCKWEIYGASNVDKNEFDYRLLFSLFHWNFHWKGTDKHLKMSSECKTVAVEPHDDSSEMCYIVNEINVSETLNVILIKRERYYGLWACILARSTV